jgi:hypothetical protein
MVVAVPENPLAQALKDFPFPNGVLILQILMTLVVVVGTRDEKDKFALLGNGAEPLPS